MADLIDRQAAIDGKISIQLANGVEIYSDEAVPVEYLKALPSAQPERRKGRWINDVAYYDEEGCPCIVSRCDQCGEPGFGRYCPCCGADMREKEDGKIG